MKFHLNLLAFYEAVLLPFMLLFRIKEMGSSNPEGSELPNPPPIPPNVVPIVAGEKPLELINKPDPPKLVPMKRPGIGSQGQRISLLTNHFKVGLNKSNTEFYHYSVTPYTLSFCPTILQYR